MTGALARRDDAAVEAAFTWDLARTWLDGLPDGRGLNIAHECVDRHVNAGHGAHDALRLVAKDGHVQRVTYDDLHAATNRFANVLESLGVSPGSRVFVLLGRGVDLYVAVLGALKARCIVCPLFSAFGPEPLHQRMVLGAADVLVTSSVLHERKRAAFDGIESLRHVLVTDGNLRDLMAAAGDTYEIGPTDPETPALLHFTSGTTGTPKGAVHVHEAIVAHHATGRFALDLHGDDVFWCTADPGWVTGTSYGIVSPLSHGVTCVVDEAEFDVARWYTILDEQEVTVWYTAPTAIRMLMRAGAEAVAGHDLSKLRFAASVGEPLNPAAVVWGRDVLGHAFHDNWWQTETGGIMVANTASMDIRPGSMGKPLPGVDADVVRVDAEGQPVRDGTGAAALVPVGADEEGLLVLRRGWPSMFRTYLGNEARYLASFCGEWYLTGDLVRRDADGYVWFVSRADDVIKTAGHLVGPFEVESALMEHPAVAEAGVYGVPDPMAGALIHAVVSVRGGVEASDKLAKELLGFARSRLGAAIAPRQITFAENLPKTRSGKVMRRLLRARELGLEEGDTSTLEVTGQ
ncbi:MAG: acetate--CoA ligase [Acidimicrobiia bacterium]